MSLKTLWGIFPLLISSTALYLSLKAIRDSRWDRFLITVEGMFSSGVDNKGAYVRIEIEITNVGRVPATMTDVFMKWSDDREAGKAAFDTKHPAFKKLYGGIYLIDKLPIVIAPNSSYRFVEKDYRDSENTNMLGQLGATFIRRPTSPKKVTHASSRTNVYGRISPYPQYKFSGPVVLDDSGMN